MKYRMFLNPISDVENSARYDSSYGIYKDGI